MMKLTTNSGRREILVTGHASQVVILIAATGPDADAPRALSAELDKPEAAALIAALQAVLKSI